MGHSLSLSTGVGHSLPETGVGHSVSRQEGGVWELMNPITESNWGGEKI